MAKYIIELEDEPLVRKSCLHGEDAVYKVKGFKNLVFDKCDLDKLTLYTEPDREAIENETWELAERIADMSYGDFISCFEGEPDEYVYGLPYHEVKAKYEIWKRDKEEIHVGDEVKPKTSQRKGTIISEGTDYVRVLFEDVDYPFISAWEKKNVIKTGRHFDEMGRLLEKMKENNYGKN